MVAAPKAVAPANVIKSKLLIAYLYKKSAPDLYSSALYEIGNGRLQNLEPIPMLPRTGFLNSFVYPCTLCVWKLPDYTMNP